MCLQAPGERNFHVFHQLSSGAPSDLRQALHIGQPESYAYLSHEARKINGVNDAVNFKGLCECLRILGFEAAVGSNNGSCVVWLRLLSEADGAVEIRVRHQVQQQQPSWRYRCNSCACSVPRTPFALSLKPPYPFTPSIYLSIYLSIAPVSALQDQRDLWRIMSTVLNLGNLEFTSEVSQGTQLS